VSPAASPHPAAPSPRLLAGGAVLGALVGLGLAWAFGGRFAAPSAVDGTRWTIVSPGRDAAVDTPALGRGTHVSDGALVIREHAFQRADTLTPRVQTPVARLVIDLAPTSGTTRIVFRGAAGETALMVRLSPEAYASTPGPPASYPREAPGPWDLRIEEGVARMHHGGRVRALGPARPGLVDIGTAGGETRIRGLELRDADGNLIVEDRFDRSGPGGWILAAGAVLGAVAGACLGVLRRTAPSPAEALPAAVFLLTPVGTVLATPSASWLYAVERLYLVRTPAWTFATLALGCSMVPLVGVALLRTGWLAPRPAARRDRDVEAWGAASLVSALAAAWMDASPAWSVVPGVAFLALPGGLALRSGTDARRALLLDSPALLACAGLGWAPGVLVATLWRIVVALAGVRTYLAGAARPAVDHLAMLALAVPIGAEVAARGSYLDVAWDAARLSGEAAAGATPGLPAGEGHEAPAVDAADWRDPLPFWTGTCGGASADAVGVVYVGGSSTGGAYQFQGEPTAFFPAQVHARLCERPPEGRRLVSVNYGGGGRDTWTIRQSLARTLARTPARLVVVYTGVNDLLTSSGMTRKEREARTAAWRTSLEGAGALAARVRLLTGASLLLRPLHAMRADQVPDVPLPDAEENLTAIAAIARDHGAGVLLVPEYVVTASAPAMEGYAAMERRVAAAHPDVGVVDLRAALAGTRDEELLVDRNHLSRAGAGRVAEVLAPRVADALGLPHPADPRSP
jgi:hypothetical protein